MAIKDIALTSLDEILAFDLTGTTFLFALDELQDITLSNAQETSDITGKAGRKLNTLKRNKSVTISGNNGLVSCGLLEMQTGNKFEEKTATPVMWHDDLTITNNAATTTDTAIGTAGAEITKVYVKDADGMVISKLDQDSAAGDGKFAYDPSTKKLTFKTGEFTDGTEIAVYYYKNVTGSVLNNDSDVYSDKCMLFIDATGEDTCGLKYRVQIRIPKADFNGNFDFGIGSDQTPHAFEAESLAGACASAGRLWEYTVYGL